MQHNGKEVGPRAQKYWDDITKDRNKAGWYFKYRIFRKLVKQGV